MSPSRVDHYVRVRQKSPIAEGTAKTEEGKDAADKAAAEPQGWWESVSAMLR